MKQYKDYENYTVQRDGTVYSKYAKRNISISKYKKNKQGNKTIYPRVHLSRGGKAKWFALHRIVAECYIPNPENKPHINHKDGDRLNNNADNLEWCTHEENIDHAMKNDLNPKGENHGIAIATTEIVYTIREMRISGMTYPAIAEALGMKESTVGVIGRGQNWKHIK